MALSLVFFLNEEGGGYSMDSWLSVLTEVGFPVAVTFYLLHRIEGKLNVLIESIHELPERMR